MQLKYGSYTHDENEVWMTWDQQSLESDSGIQIGYKRMVTINGFLQEDTQAALTTSMNALRTAYQVNGRDLVLYDNSGSQSAVFMFQSGSESGVQITRISMPELNNAEYTTYINYRIEAEAEYITTSLPYHSYRESYSRRGNGGPRKVVLEGAYQTVEQLTRQRTAVFGVQAGEASKIGSYPDPPQPFFPNLLQNPDEAVSTDAAWDNGKRLFIVRWNYQFLSGSFFDAKPIQR